MATIIQLRRDTAANWTAINPILNSGEQGLETDSDKRKVGDGITVWSGLPYDSLGVSAHSATHEVGGTDELLVSGLSGLLADGQSPLAHKITHQSGGSDAIKLDDLEAPDDNTDLNASVARHGLLAKLSGINTEFLNGDGEWVPGEGKTIATQLEVDTGTDTTKIVTPATLRGTNDFYPAGDKAGLYYRAVNNFVTTTADLVDGFDGSALDARYTWAGAPFVTPTTSFAVPSTLRVAFAASTSRAFMYTSNLNDHSMRLALATNVPGAFVGSRFDDGTDNNYFETVLRHVAANQYDIITTTRLGGGAVVTTVQKVLDYPMWSIIKAYTYGTQWTNWGEQSLWFVDSPGFYVFTTLVAQTWTPTRKGIVFNHPAGGASWQQYILDWHKYQ